MYVRAALPLGPYPARMTDRLDYWAAHVPERTFLARRDAGGEWRQISWEEARAHARNIAQALINRGLSQNRQVVILSGNDLDHALLGLGAMYAGVPYAPISPAYSLLSSDFGKLRRIFAVLNPGLVFAASGREFERAITAVAPPGVEIVNSTDPLSGATLFRDLIRTKAGSGVEAAHAQVTPDTVLKILFTSGSTGIPKGVINTHRMWAANQEMVRTCWPFLKDEPPVLLEWLPWNHTFAGNKDFGLVLYNGGSLYLDDGKPIPGAYEETIRNLREIPTTIHLNVPRGFEALIPWLRRDPELRRTFFRRLRFMFYAGAGITQPVWDALEELSIQTCGERILMLSGLGSTETAPFAFWSGKDSSRAGDIGIPAPGLELKLVPSQGKLEARLRGPSLTPGYWGEEKLTRAAFDEEGFYKLGDALKFVDQGNPGKGFLFDGRIAEDFKLATATWVSAGPLRAEFLSHFAPYVRDVVIAGRDRDFVSGLVFPDSDRCRELCPELDSTASMAEVVGSKAVQAKFHERLCSLALRSTGSSNRIARILLLSEPPSIDAHELTDKGSISQRAVLENRASLVEELYAGSPRVIGIDESYS
jgi:feruloyl-CoA synthase